MTVARFSGIAAAKPLMNYSMDKLPSSPKRLAKAAAAAGWTWNSSFASGQDEYQIHMVDSIVVRCAISGVRVVARWESVDGGKLALAVTWHYVQGEWPRKVNFNEAISIVASNPVVR